MSKAAYTEEEVKKVLRSLFVEKRRVKELQEKVQDIGQERSALRDKLALLETNAERSGHLEGAILPRASLRDSVLTERLAELQERVESGDAPEIAVDTLAELQAVSAQMAMLHQALEEKDRELEIARQSDSSEQVTKLKRAVVLLKKKCDAAALPADDAELRRTQERLQKELQLSQEIKTDYDRVTEELRNTNHQLSRLRAESSSSVHTNEALETNARLLSDLKHQNEQLLGRLREKDDVIERLRRFEQSFQKSTQERRELEETLHTTQEALEGQSKQETALAQEVQQQRFAAMEATEQLTLAQSKNRALEDKLSSLSEENISLSRTMEEVRAETQKLTSGNEAKNAQLNELGSRLTEFSQTQQKVNRLKEDSARLEEERDQARAKLGQRTARLTEVDKELDLIKQTLIRGVRESKDLENHYMEVVNEKVTAIAKAKKAADALATAHLERDRAKERLSEGSEQHATLEARIEELHLSIENLTAHNHTLQEQVEKQENDHFSLSEEKEDLVVQNRESEERNSASENLIEELRQEITTLEVLRSELDQSRQDLAQANHRIDQLEKVAADAVTLREEHTDLEDRYENLREEFSTLSSQIEGAIETRQEAERGLVDLELRYAAKQQILDEKNLELEHLRTAKDSLEASVKELQDGVTERDRHLAQAQQHLAKKMKENTIFHERLEHNKIQTLEKQNQLNSNKSKLNELTRSLELQQQQEKKMQVLLNETMKSVENQATKWEEKYFRIYDKWQSAESRIKELQKLEEEYKKLHGLMSNLGNYFGGPTSTTPAAAPPTIPSLDRPIAASVSAVSSQPPSGQDLFGLPGPRQHVGPSLFED